MERTTSSTESPSPVEDTSSTTPSDSTSNLSWTLCPVTGIAQVTWTVSAAKLRRIRSALQRSAELTEPDNPDLAALIRRELQLLPVPPEDDLPEAA